VRGKPALYGDLHRWALIHAEALALLRALPDACVDCVASDPPYGIGFTDRRWDGADIRRAVAGEQLSAGEAFARWTSQWASELRRVLKPGGWLVAFGSPRTYHRLVCGIEDAGLEVRDTLMWLHAAGVPKTLRFAGDRGTALKPSYEPIVLARAAVEAPPQRTSRPGEPARSMSEPPARTQATGRHISCSPTIRVVVRGDAMRTVRSRTSTAAGTSRGSSTARRSGQPSVTPAVSGCRYDRCRCSPAALARTARRRTFTQRSSRWGSRAGWCGSSPRPVA
jgi:hypothetical protein